MAEVRPDEVSAILRKQLSGFESDIDVFEVGTVLQIGDNVARIYGLKNCLAGELIEFPNNSYGMALNLEEDNVGCVLFGESTAVKEGDTVKRTGKVASMPVGDAMLGRVIDPLGRPLDGRGIIRTEQTMPIERKALGVLQRQPVKEPLQTGIKAIDSMIPIGRGQRELIIGDRQTGKTALALDTIINQKHTHTKESARRSVDPVYCIYVAIGQKASTVAQVHAKLEEMDAMPYTTIIMADANSPAPLQYVAPYSGATLGEYFRDGGRHALVIFDDLSKQAVAYRQLSLLLRRPPGREAYPGDVFYLHSRLLERASKLNDNLGAGSLTALPIIETQAGDVSAYIPTNVISITDGQIYLESDLFNAGQRPAVNVGISVSRVGGNAQIKAYKQIAGSLRIDLAQYRELEAFAKFGSDLDKTTQQLLRRGARMLELLKQVQYQPMTVQQQVAVLFAGVNGFIDEVPLDQVARYEQEYIEYVQARHPEIINEIADEKQLSDELQEKMKAILKEFTNSFMLSLNNEQ